MRYIYFCCRKRLSRTCFIVYALVFIGYKAFLCCDVCLSKFWVSVCCGETQGVWGGVDHLKLDGFYYWVFPFTQAQSPDEAPSLWETSPPARWGHWLTALGVGGAESGLQPLAGAPPPAPQAEPEGAVFPDTAQDSWCLTRLSSSPIPHGIFAPSDT